MKTTYWKGENLGPQRMEFMKNNLRLKQIELPTEGEIKYTIEVEAGNILHPSTRNRIAKAITNLLKGER